MTTKQPKKNNDNKTRKNSGGEKNNDSKTHKNSGGENNNDNKTRKNSGGEKNDDNKTRKNSGGDTCFRKKNDNKNYKKSGGEKKIESKRLQTGAGDIVNDFIEDVWKVMTPAMIERLKQILTEDLGISKIDTNKFIQCQRDIRRQRICLKKTTREVRIGPRNQWIKELSKDIADQIAKFIVSILLSERNDRTKKLTEQVLDRLCEVTGENTTIESAETRVERVLVIVADRLATWINENITDVELKLKEGFSRSLDTLSDATFAEQKSIGSSKGYGIRSMSDLSEDHERFKDSLVTFDSDVLSTEGEGELSEDEESDEKESESEKSSGRSDVEEESEDESEKSTSEEESSAQESEEESSAVEEEGGEEEEEESADVDDEEEESGADESGEAESVEVESEEEETENEEEEEAEEDEIEEESVPEENIAVEEEEELSKHTSVSSGSLHAQSESEITTSVVSPMDILDLLREDLERLPKSEKKSERQQAMKEVIDKRLKKIAQEKRTGSLDSIVKFDIDETSSIVANWVEKILSAADDTEALPKDPEPKQGSAFEIMRGEGSQLKVHKLSSMTVAKQVAELRGLEPPLRKKKIPRTMSPINIKSMNDWADWALGTANVGKEWDKWLDETLKDVESQLAKDRDSESREERHEAWNEWRENKAKEATKWRAEKRRIRAEGALWNRKLESGPTKPEQETRAVSY